MIPRGQIAAWRSVAPWSTDAQVEQDLVLTRALVEMYSDDLLREALIFRGGTAIHKLYLSPPARYSEDLDFVQARGGPAGEIVNAVRRRLDPWLGKPKRDRSTHTCTLTYRFTSEIAPITPLKVKIEINTREHFTVLGFEAKTVAVKNGWFNGSAEVATYKLPELLGTKLRALYQRSKGRDLFDLAVALQRFPAIDPAEILRCFHAHIEHQGVRITRTQFEENLSAKLADPAYRRDVEILLAPELAPAGLPLLLNVNTAAPTFDVARAGEAVRRTFLEQMS